MDVLKSSGSKSSMLNSLTKSIKGTVLKEALSDIASQKSEIKGISIKTLLDSLIKDLAMGAKSKDAVLQILREKNISFSVKDTISDLKSIANTLKQSNVSEKKLNGLFLSIEKLDGKSLERQIRQSGIFLESKLANMNTSKESDLMLKDDIKANLLQLKDELVKSGDVAIKDVIPKIDRALVNINYYQLVSYGMSANMLYLPLLWDDLDEGEVSIKRLKQKRFFCEINLKLKDFGKIDLLIMLFNDIDINISIFTQNDEFLSRIRDNLQLLRKGINSVGLTSSNIYLYNSLRDEKIKKETKEYVDTQQIGLGISLHV